MARRTHDLKIWPEFYEAVRKGHKTYEVRKYDREYHFGDKVVLRAYDPERTGTMKPGGVMEYGDPIGFLDDEPLEFWIGYIYRTKIEGEIFAVFSLLHKDPFEA